MKQLDYQLDAIQKLKNKSDELLNLHGNHTVVFKAPTGSGKTVMMAEYLKYLVEYRNDGKVFSFIWTAPRKLHTQSKEKLEKHYHDSKALKCVSFGDLSDRMIGENEILFLNWESINREDNIYYRENEQEFFLEKVIENTKDDGRIIVLIIDESHHTAGAENTQGLIAIINAKLTVEVSATPKISGDEVVTVYRQKVVEEEMIKKRIAINPDFKNTILQQLPSGDVKVKSDAEESTNEFVIRKALEERKKLAKLFEDEGSNVNPLMLIQLPDRRHGQLDFKDEIIDILKDNHDITVDNDRLAVYLSEDKENLSTITKNDSPVEVMIFKQAIALGWDCPRASILVLFRDWQSIVFSIQTVGRIMRMPELKHYANDDLNVGYIYTNLSDISIHQDITDGYATIYHPQRNDDIYEDIQLQSCHSVRQRERTRLAPKFMKHFLIAAEELDLKNKISTDIAQITHQLITDGVISNPDEEFEHLQEERTDTSETHISETVERKLNEEEIQHLFDQFSFDALSPLYPEERSINRINKSIYEFFKNEFPMKFQYAGVDEQMVVLADVNRQRFLDVINLSKEKYLEEVEKRARELAIDEIWEIPPSLSYSFEYTKRHLDLSIMQPFYEKTNASTVEKKFAKFLNDQKHEIEWWFKNGERDRTFFAVPRKEGEDYVPFYVDWIVKYKNGRIGLFDTKAGITAETAGSRSEGLFKYIKEQNQIGKNLFGGIVIEKNETFWLHSKKEYQYDENDLIGAGWEILS
ncbi:MAG: DEAD/DEAH box helicase family protein [candidate division Zixibacteria bacterium]|nr:DEAD/DEAH box helicase family protein [candidate division Zixibacteria bacterium]